MNHINEEAMADRLIHIGARRLLLNLDGEVQEKIIYVSIGYHHPQPCSQAEPTILGDETQTACT